MKQLVQSFKNGHISIVDVPIGEPGAREVQIRSKVSLISAGTERMLVSFGRASMIQKAKSQPDKVKQVLEKVKNEGLLDTIDAVSSKLEQPTPLGYSNVGVVINVGKDVNEFQVGDRVVSNGRHAEIVNVGVNLVDSVPNNVPSSLAAFSIVGSIGLQGIRLLKPEFGETIVVYGAGLIGLLAIQMLLRNGCNVLAVDINSKNLEIAEKYGARTLLAQKNVDFESQLIALNESKVVDGVLVTASAKNDEIIKNSCKVLRKRGRIVLTGVVSLDFDRSWLYEKEISFQVSSSYGPGRYEPAYELQGFDYPIGFVRWTEKRNIKAVLDGMSKGWIDVRHVSRSSYSFDKASDAYQALTGESEQSPPMAIELVYKQQAEPRHEVELSGASNGIGQPVISVLGAGNYAVRRMLPALTKNGAQIKHIVSKGGLSSSLAALKFKARFASVNINSVFSDSEVEGVCIATRHNTHSPLALQAVRSGKYVFVEKPLVITLDELTQFKELTDAEKSRIFVGFNREYSTYVNLMKSQFSSDISGKIISLEMNAGRIPPDHWTQDPEVGGGRLIGEAIHYISLAGYLSGSKAEYVFVTSLQSESQLPDSFLLVIKYSNGDLANITYHSVGSSKYKKESIKCVGGGKVLEIDNFKSLKGWGPNLSMSKSSLRQKKGQNECFNNFVDHVGDKKPNQLDRVESYFQASEVAIRASNILFKCSSGEFYCDF